jgi:Kef-type K+ transport system membrane component KefB
MTHIYPSASLPYISLVSTIGLVFFLFLVGVEVDFAVFKSNYKKALTISAVGMIVPFGIKFHP